MMGETDAVDNDCTGFGGHSPEQMMIMAGVGGGGSLASPILPFYRLEVVEWVKIPRFGHYYFVFWPVLCAKRGIISLQPLLMLVKSVPWVECGSVCTWAHLLAKKTRLPAIAPMTMTGVREEVSERVSSVELIDIAQ
jgi:hypothetical protein